METLKTTNLLVKQGATFKVPFKLTYKKTALPFDLTGYTGRSHIRASATDPVQVAEFVVTITDALNGEGEISMSAETSAAIPLEGSSATDYTIFNYDVELFNDTKVIRAMCGKVYISPEVTK